MPWTPYLGLGVFDGSWTFLCVSRGSRFVLFVLRVLFGTREALSSLSGFLLLSAHFLFHTPTIPPKLLMGSIAAFFQWLNVPMGMRFHRIILQKSASKSTSNLAGRDCNGDFYNFLLGVINFPKDLRWYFKGYVPIGPINNCLGLCDDCDVSETSKISLAVCSLSGVYVYPQNIPRLTTYDTKS
jgi:hypothetical protein